MGRSLAVAIFCALALSGAALAGNGGIAPVEPLSPNAERINDSYLWIALFTGAIFLLVQSALLWFIFRYRRGKRPRTEDGAQIHGHTNLELAWTVVPVLILVAIGSFIFYKLPGIQDVPSADAAGGRVDVQVKGYRFYWQFTYPNGVVSIDRLRAPVGRNVRLEITTAPTEVIHSWWVPSLGGKFDAIPGVVNETWFNAAAPGTYRGQCAEFCGELHAEMKGEVEAVPAEEFDSWLEEEARSQEAGTSTLGRELFTGVCEKCHGLSGEGDLGPRLRGNPLLDDPRLVEDVVRHGRRTMPAVGPDWDDRQMDALTAYLQDEVLGGS